MAVGRMPLMSGEDGHAYLCEPCLGVQVELAISVARRPAAFGQAVRLALSIDSMAPAKASPAIER